MHIVASLYVTEESGKIKRKKGYALAYIFVPFYLIVVNITSVRYVTLYLCTLFEAHWTPTHNGSTRILCSQGITNVLVDEEAKDDGQLHCVHLHCSCACSLVSLDFILWHSFKDKTIKNFTHQIKKLLHSQRNHHQNKRGIHCMEEHINQWYIW